MATVTRETETVRMEREEDGTQTPHREAVFVYVHCFNKACGLFHDPQQDAVHERRVPGVRTETSFSYFDLDGDAPGTERSTVSWHPQDEQDLVCPECGEWANVSEQPHREIPRQNLSAGDGLKGAERAAAIVAAKQAKENEESKAQSDGQVAELRAQVELLTELMKAKPETED